MTTGKNTTTYKKGDVVLIPFPFTDLSATKTRPAVVVSIKDFQKKVGDFTVAMITSVPHTTPYDYQIKDWQRANLLAPSWIRAKLVTIDPQLVRYQPGKLTAHDLQQIEKRLRLALWLSG
jgi:mRNA interferase MazF